MKIHLASDHAGYLHKKEALDWLVKKGYHVIDHGAHNLDPDDDFPDFIYKAVKNISKNPADRAIVFGGSGQGEAMMANRLEKVRATVYYGGSDSIIFLSREHNNANVLSIGARFVPIDDLPDIMQNWLGTDFPSESRHERRINKIDTLAFGPLYTELLGWAGVLLILSAFISNVINLWPSDSYPYLMMNALGAICVVIDAYFDRNIQPVILNSIWFLVALIGIFIL